MSEKSSDCAASATANSFGWELLRRAVALNPSANIVLSPASVATALAMVAAGAVDETLDELSKALQFADSAECVRSSSQLSRSLSSAVRKGVELSCANGVFADRTLQLNKEFEAVVRDEFRAEAMGADFMNDAESGRRSINSWVSSRTNSKIPELLSAGSVDSDTRAVLVNAVHFKGEWQHKFNSAASYDGQFESSSEAGPAPARMMSQTRDFLYSETQHLRTVEMPFNGGECSCVLMLPVLRHGLDSALLQAGGVHAALKQAREAQQEMEVELHVPKLKIECQLDLDQAPYLPDCGAVRVFDRERAQLNKMSNERLFVSKVVHKAVLEFDEEGAEAAAATAAAIACMCMPMNVVFMANEPFAVAIRDKATDSLLFLAKVCKPQ